MTQLDALRPTVALHVMDLVREAGIDVDDWANFKGGPARANTNPKYCYRWAFADHRVVVLNLWFDGLDDEDGLISLSDNLRATAASHNTKGVWKSRAAEFDHAVRFAYDNALPVRAIINLGKRRQGTSRSTEASKVRVRLLDPLWWAVTAYEVESGQFTVTRGARPIRSIDQFALGSEGTSVVERHPITKEAYTRSPEVRRRVLARAAGRCEYCGATGFETVSGWFFLETHHVIPLSEGGHDAIYNVAALCPNHHREAHHGLIAGVIRSALLMSIGGQSKRVRLKET